MGLSLGCIHHNVAMLSFDKDDVNPANIGNLGNK
jgi:hypothetical protein